MRVWLPRLPPAAAAAAISAIGLGPAHAQGPRPAPAGPPLYPAQAPAPAAAPPLEAGGLRPPAPAPASSRETETLRQLERAEQEDAGRGLEFVWVDADLGYEHIWLQALGGEALLDGSAVPDSGGGLALGAGLGVRLIFLTLGARLRLVQLDHFDLWTLGGEVGLHVPLGAIEPSFSLGVGYAALSGARAGAVELDVSGLDVRLGANLDYYVNPLLSFGARVAVDTLFSWRSAAPAAPGAAAAELYEESGSGVGLGLFAGAGAGLHF